MAQLNSCSWVWLVLPCGYTKHNWALCQMMFALLVSSQLCVSSLKRVGRCGAWEKKRCFFLIRPLSMFGHKVMKGVQDEPGKGTGRWKPSAGRSQPGLRGEENNSSRTQSIQGRICFYSTVKKFPGSMDVVDDEKDVQTTILFICPWLLHFPYLKTYVPCFFQTIFFILSLAFLEDFLV